jgi:hypothetical protein
VKIVAPICLFVYNRLDHTQRTVDSLNQNLLAQESDLIIFSDAHKLGTQSDKVAEVREYIHQISGFKSVTVVERDVNYGLAKSIIDGVTKIVNEHGRIIVLEDDMVTSPYFLTYMNEALEKYADDNRVVSIHGYVYPVKQSLPEAFFLRGADCWGWATWQRGWAHFNPDGQYLIDELKRRKLIGMFDFNGAYSFSKMLKAQIKGSNDSWAVRWHASAFLADKLTLHPGRSLVHNIGNDASGTHCGESNIHDVLLSVTPIDISGVEVIPSILGYQAFELFYRQSQGNLMQRISRSLATILRKIRACLYS